jgi:ADP-ribose pyrophosphatase YjhB (NUDIX family)
MLIVRHSARAILIDDTERLVTIKRTRPHQPPYWTTPGGGVEPADASREAATARELAEELGAIARIGPQVFLATTPWGEGVQVQHFFLSRLINIDATLRTGPEYDDPGRGTYELDRVPLDDLPGVPLRPIQVREFIIANTAALLADLPTA